MTGFNDTTQSYGCWRCGATVPSGCTHACPTSTPMPQVIVIPPVVITTPIIVGNCR